MRQGDTEIPEGLVMSVTALFCISSFKTTTRYAKASLFFPLGSVTVEDFTGNICTELQHTIHSAFIGKIV